MISEPALVALITALVGPAAVVLIKAGLDRRATASATEKPRDHRRASDPATVSELVLGWATQLNDQVKAMKLSISDLRGTVAGLEGQVATLRGENEKLRRHNELLSRQVLELGGTPWRMPD